MEYRQDFLWKESTLSERVDEKVGKYLRKNHPEYQKIKKQIKEMMQQHPNVRAVFETDEAVTLTPEEHEILNHYFNLESSAELIEREYHFYLGQSMMFSYGTMLASIRKSIMGIEGKEPQGIGAVPAECLTDHLVDISSDIRTDELEEELQSESRKYRDAIEEVTRHENAILEMGLSKEARKLIDRYVSAVNHRWILCGDFLYKSGMRDILMLLENR